LVFDRLNQEQTMAKESDAPIQIEVISFVPRWTAVDDDRRLTLREHGAANVIGDGAVLGGRARDWQGQFRLRIGPLLARQFDLLQPLTSSREKVPVPTLFHGIVELTRRYVGPEFSFELNLVIRAEEIPQTRLLDRDRQPSRLGRTWLITRTPKDDGECIFRASNRRAGP
jgi:type VI secretion system protein ImpH